MLWSDKISKYPVFFFFLRVNSSGKCDLLGVPLEGASTLHIYICINTQPMFVWAAHTHTCQIAAFSLMLYGSTPVFLILSHSFHTRWEGLPKDSPSSQWAAGTQGCGKWKSTINETVNNDRKMGSWVQLLSWLSFPGRDLGGRFEISAILMKYKERRS